MDFEQAQSRLIYKYLRGSHLYGLNNEQSDFDYAGIYVCDDNDLLGLGRNYKDQVSDAKSDIVYWEIKRFLELAAKGNPSTTEALFVPERCIIIEHALIRDLKQYRHMFLTKHMFDAITGYAISQIEKARGLNKKIVNPVNKLKGLMDFCYVADPDIQGSRPLERILNYYGFDQKYCGLVDIPHMQDMYNVFYDWKAHIEDNDISLELFKKDIRGQLDEPLRIVWPEDAYISPTKWYNSLTRQHYKGIFKDNSKQVCLSSVEKGSKPIFQMSFNQNAYSQHCQDYMNYKRWEKERNPVRYESNLDKNYDSKNMMHCFRLINMCIELAQTGELNVDRTNIDREFLMDIRLHKYEYDELMDILHERKQIMDIAIKSADLGAEFNYDFFDDWLIDARKWLSRETHII